MYCNNIWFPLLNKVQQESLYMLQKSLVRCLYKVSPHTHCAPLFKDSKILMIRDCVVVSNCKLIYRILTDQIAVPIKRFFVNEGISSSTRNAHLLVLKHNLAIVNKSFLCRAVMDWSTLKPDLKTICNIKNFSRRLNISLIEKY